MIFVGVSAIVLLLNRVLEGTCDDSDAVVGWVGKELEEFSRADVVQSLQCSCLDKVGAITAATVLR